MLCSSSRCEGLRWLGELLQKAMEQIRVRKCAEKELLNNGVRSKLEALEIAAHGS